MSQHRQSVISISLDSKSQLDAVKAPGRSYGGIKYLERFSRRPMAEIEPKVEGKVKYNLFQM